MSENEQTGGAATVDCEKLLRDIAAGCKEECADCEYSKGTEFECSILNDCAQSIAALVAQVERLRAERDDALELLHSYRHICGEYTPDALSRLVQADCDGRCLVLPFKVGQTVRHKTEGWTGQVNEITLNNEGLMLFVSSGGYAGYYPPSMLDKIADASEAPKSLADQDSARPAHES